MSQKKKTGEKLKDCFSYIYHLLLAVLAMAAVSAVVTIIVNVVIQGRM